MKVEFLGSGGAIPTPRPGCDCKVCCEAREKGVPYSRMGPGVFIHGPDILIDTPEEARLQLDRSTLNHVPACIYSHWHPDHIMGRRVFETMNADWRTWPPTHSVTDIYIPEGVAEDFRKFLGMMEQLEYLQRFGVLRIIELHDGESFPLNGWDIRPFRLAEAYVYAFLFTKENQKVLIAPDELVGWAPPDFVKGADLAILPMGIPEFDVFTGKRLIPTDHPVLGTEATFRQTLEMVKKLGARRVIMTHLEEPFRLGFDDYLRLQVQLQADGYPIDFAYDTMIVEA
nr:hypothetical protein [Anaerolineae bacterium]